MNRRQFLQQGAAAGFWIAGRQLGFGQMMIGDDYVDTQLISAPHHFGGADTGIHADDQLYASCGRFIHDLRPHAVAFTQPVRNMERRRAAGECRR